MTMPRDSAPKDVQDRYDTFVDRLDDFVSGLLKKDSASDLDLMVTALINMATDIAVAAWGAEGARKELLEILETHLSASAKAVRDEMH
jgi:hypothetical protein